MTVGFVMNKLSYANSHRIGLINYLQNNGIKVIVFASRDCENTYGFDFVNISFNPGFPSMTDFSHIYVLKKLLLNSNIDVVHTFSPKVNLITSLCRLNIPVVYSFNGLGYMANSRLFLNLFSVFFRFLVIGKTFFLVVQNEDDKIYFSQFFASKRVRKIRGSGLSQFAVMSDLVEKKFQILVVSRLLKDKGILELLEAARVLESRRKGYKIVVVGGEDENPNSLRLQELRLQSSPNLVFLGKLPKEEVYRLMQSSLAFLLPSYREGLSFAVIEAAAHSLPLILTDVPGLREQVIDGYNGFVIKPKSVDAIVSGIDRLISSESRLEFGKNSRKLFEEYWELNNIGKEFVELYKNLLAKI